MEEAAPHQPTLSVDSPSRGEWNYFQMFGLSVQYGIDEKVLQTAYFQLQRASHPDQLKRLDDAGRQKALLDSAAINQAYETLKNPLLRAEYLLSLQGVIVGSEKDTVKPSPQLLMESMEQREALMEADSVEAVKGLEQAVVTLQADIQIALHGSLDARDWQTAAAQALRLRYLTKFLQEARGRIKLLQAKVS